jgi:hypothetical protein
MVKLILDSFPKHLYYPTSLYILKMKYEKTLQNYGYVNPMLVVKAGASL